MMTKMHTAVFLDRDNTVIENNSDLGDPDKVKLIRGVASAIASLRGLGFKIVVVTNQAGVARGKFTEKDVHAVNHRINQLVNDTAGVVIDRFYYCPYHPEANVEKYRKDHPWRKPHPGMLMEAANDLKLDLSRSWMIGDDRRDVEAGIAAGTRTIMLDAQMDQWTPGEVDPSVAQSHLGGGQAVLAPHFLARNLVDAVKIVVQHRSPELRTATRHRSLTNGAVLEGALGATAPLVEKEAAATASQPPPEVASNPKDRERSNRVAREDAGAQRRAQSINANQEMELTSHDIGDERTNDREAGQLLGQILQELRHQRGEKNDFSYLTMMAIVMQMLALVCLLAGFWMGASNQDLFIRWLGTGILIQLGAIAMLQFQKHS